VRIKSGKTLKRKLMRALLAAVIGGAGVIATAQPAQAAVVIPRGASGHACSAYQYITSTLYFQACAWASGGREPRVWFTGHFGNRGRNNVTLPFVSMGFYENGQFENCSGVEQDFTIPAGIVRPTGDGCWIPRIRAAAYQAWIQPEYNRNYYPQLSPTIQVL